MHLLGIFFALGAGLFFGILAPTTKIAFNLGVGVGLAILLRFLMKEVWVMGEGLSHHHHQEQKTHLQGHPRHRLPWLRRVSTSSCRVTIIM